MFSSRVYKDDLKRVCQVYKDLDMIAKTAKFVTKRYLIRFGGYTFFASDINVDRLIHRPIYIANLDWVDEWDGNFCFTWYIIPLLMVSPLVSARIDVDINVERRKVKKR